MQELLHKLLRAEAVLQEQERHTWNKSASAEKSPVTQAGKSQFKHTTGSNNRDSQNGEKPNNQKDKQLIGASAEMSSQGLKCFKCQKRGYLAKECPDVKQKPPSRRVAEETGDEEKGEETEKPSEPDPWMRTVTTEARTNEAVPSQIVTRGPIFSFKWYHYRTYGRGEERVSGKGLPDCFDQRPTSKCCDGRCGQKPSDS